MNNQLTATEKQWLERAAENSRLVQIPIEMASFCCDCKTVSNCRGNLCPACGSKSIRDLVDLFRSVFGASTKSTGNSPKSSPTIHLSA